MPDPALAGAIVLGAGIVACLGTRVLIPLLARASVLDRPNERSSHIAPVPRGGGIALVAAVLAAWGVLIASGVAVALAGAVMTGAALLAAVSWIDDLRGLSPAVRLVFQAVAVAVGLLALARAGPVFQGWLPRPLDTLAAGLLWVWFLNLFNFMDGIDGIAGSEAAAIGFGLLLLASGGIAVLAGAAASAALGFLVWNWSPARIFLGDVGSVPLGYLLGFLLLSTAAEGMWPLALILPLYFLADATITLLSRLRRGERIWQPHRSHFYQRAVQRGLGHVEVVRRVVAADLLLIGCAWAALRLAPMLGLAAAAAVVAALLWSLSGGRRATPA